MGDHIDAIKSALIAENYYSAVFLAVTLPSICGAVSSQNGEDTPSKYVAWYKKYVRNLMLTGDDCYRFRCSLLHQGSTSHRKSGVTRILFTFPQANGHQLHNNIINGALNLDIPMFCNEMIDAVISWESEMQANNDVSYAKNIPKVIRLYSKGAPPYFSGIPVIS